MNIWQLLWGFPVNIHHFLSTLKGILRAFAIYFSFEENLILFCFQISVKNELYHKVISGKKNVKFIILFQVCLRIIFVVI